MNIRVLIADDHTLLAEGLRHVIESESGLEVVGHGRTGTETVHLCAQLHPHLVLMDYAMPERFDMLYTGADNAEHRPAMIHRALLG